ncbi:MAG: hypothetical protein K2X34_00465 [Hyphomonadaceae bacterium]|nr:hypothetical protein [Hyphomonadaceae bacterium]
MDELDAKIARILGEFELPTDDWVIRRVREDVDFTAECAHDHGVLALRKAEAIQLENSATKILNLARDYRLESDANLAVIRRLRREAIRRLLVTDRPAPRIWLWPCCLNFQEVWEELTDRPSGIHYGDQPSPTLLFATACCQLVDPDVNPSAIINAKNSYVEPTEVMTPEEYEAFRQSEFWRKLTRSDL